MSGKSDFVDYEPLSNSRRAQAAESDHFEVRKSVVRENAPADVEGFAEEKPEKPLLDTANTNVRKTEAHPGQLARLAIKGGHAVSYTGLFLFTMLVFIRPYELSPWLSWLSRGALITAIATLLVFIPTQLGLENTLTVRTREVNLVLLLLLLCLISVPFALDKGRAWNAFIDYSKVVVMFVVMVNVVRTETRLKALLLLIMVISVVLSVAAINDYRAGNLALGGQRIAGVIGGLFDNPNDLAIHLVTFFPIIIGLALGARSPFGKLIYLVAGLCVLGGTVVTFSRAGFLGLICVFGVLVWRLGGKNRLLVVVVTITLVAVFLVLAPGAYRQRISTTHDESSVARTGELTRSLFLAVRHPVFGVGMDNFVLFSNTEHATHNAYTQVASEIGLTGAVVYVLFLVAPIKRLRRMPNAKDAEKKRRALAYLAVGLQASLIGYMVVSFFASVAYLWYVYYLVGYAICISRIWDHSHATLRPQTLGPNI